MNGLPLKEAFSRMMKTANGKRLGLTPQAFYHHRSRLAAGEYPKEETMRQLLKAAGWSKVMEERWAK
jgi:hypothetical protein